MIISPIPSKFESILFVENNYLLARKYNLIFELLKMHLHWDLKELAELTNGESEFSNHSREAPSWDVACIILAILGVVMA